MSLISYLSLDTWSHAMLTHISPHSIARASVLLLLELLFVRERVLSCPLLSADDIDIFVDYICSPASWLLCWSGGKSFQLILYYFVIDLIFVIPRDHMLLKVKKNNNNKQVSKRSIAVHTGSRDQTVLPVWLLVIVRYTNTLTYLLTGQRWHSCLHSSKACIPFITKIKSGQEK